MQALPMAVDFTAPQAFDPLTDTREERKLPDGSTEVRYFIKHHLPGKEPSDFVGAFITNSNYPGKMDYAGLSKIGFSFQQAGQDQETEWQYLFAVKDADQLNWQDADMTKIPEFLRGRMGTKAAGAASVKVALDPKTGRYLWRLTVPEWNEVDTFTSRPTALGEVSAANQLESPAPGGPEVTVLPIDPALPDNFIKQQAAYATGDLREGTDAHGNKYWGYRALTLPGAHTEMVKQREGGRYLTLLPRNSSIADENERLGDYLKQRYVVPGLDDTQMIEIDGVRMVPYFTPHYPDTRPGRHEVGAFRVVSSAKTRNADGTWNFNDPEGPHNSNHDLVLPPYHVKVGDILVVRDGGATHFKSEEKRSGSLRVPLSPHASDHLSRW